MGDIIGYGKQVVVLGLFVYVIKTKKAFRYERFILRRTVINVFRDL